ncbi:MAG: hypothetical protein WCL19_11505, partial [Verrucomicrobiota bacterium]
MKTYLALISFGILSLQSFATAAEEMIKYPQLLRSADVKITQSYTPFGNTLEFNKFGDDGSSCVLDASGVLTWIDKDGTVRVLPNSDLAVPLYVTATECLVWNNRFADYASYSARPNAVLKLYRAAAGSTVLTEVPLPAFAAKEILDTPPITNTTSPLTFVTATRKDNGKETGLAYGAVVDFVNYSDDCELRVYRLTAGAGVQFLKNYNMQVKSTADFTTNSSGPNVSAIGYGSDGSVALEFADAFTTGGYTVDDRNDIFFATRFTPYYYNQVLWLDDQGRSAEVLKTKLVDGTTPPAVKILSTTKTRLLYQVAGANNDPTLNVALNNGSEGVTTVAVSADTAAGILNNVAQVETATASGTVSASGDAKVTVTATALGGAKTLLVPVVKGQTPDQWAVDVRTALNANGAVAGSFDVGGSGSSITLTLKAQALDAGISIFPPNDTTLNLALENGTSSGLTPAPTSSNTKAGAINNVAQVETATADGTILVSGNAKVVVTAGVIGAPKTLLVPVSKDDTRAQWAAKVRAALSKELQVLEYFEVSGDSNLITLTRKPQEILGGVAYYAKNDGTLNIALENATASGITPTPTSTDKAAGALNNVAQVETAVASGMIQASGKAEVVVTADASFAPQTFLVAVSKDDSPEQWAATVRAAISTNALVLESFEVGGANSTITLTRKPQMVIGGVAYYAKNDDSLNISLKNGSASGITPTPTSVDKTAGALYNVAQVETATANGVITATGNAEVTLISAAINGGAAKQFMVAV